MRTSLLNFRSISDHNKNLNLSSLVGGKKYCIAYLLGAVLVVPAFFGLIQNSSSFIHQSSFPVSDIYEEENIMTKKTDSKTTVSPESASDSIVNKVEQSSSLNYDIKNNTNNSTTSVSIESSTSISSGQDSSSGSSSYSKKQTGPGQVIIKRQEGNSTVKYRLNVSGNSESEVRVRERGGSVDIDFEERSR